MCVCVTGLSMYTVSVRIAHTHLSVDPPVRPSMWAKPSVRDASGRRQFVRYDCDMHNAIFNRTSEHNVNCHLNQVK